MSAGNGNGLRTGPGKKAEAHLFSGIYGEINSTPGFHPKTGGCFILKILWGHEKIDRNLKGIPFVLSQCI